MTKKLKILELFGGIGAPRKALERIIGKENFKVIDYVDILKYAVIAYNSMYIHKYFPTDIQEWNLEVDILIHGSPCQDFSLAGKRKGGEKNSGTKSSLLWETVDIIKNRLVKLPHVIIWENVKGVLNKNNIGTFQKYLDQLKKIGIY